jgi:spore coat polysaccharide biosynthesis predicted glycosyltransferase SpsG
MHVILIPSVEGGIGHISRTATLAKRITELDPTVTFEYVLDTTKSV